MRSMILVFVVALSSAVALAQTNDSSTSPENTVQAKQKTQYASGGFGVSMIIPQVGLMLSNWTGGGSDGTQNKTGLGAGVLLDFGSNDVVLETGLVYQQLGIMANENGVNIEIDMNYLSLPIAAKYYFSGQDSNSAYLRGGVQPMFLVSNSATLTALGGSETISNLNVNSFDFAPFVGLGGKLAISDNADFLVEGDYYRGLTQVNSTGGSSVNNSFATFMAGVGVRL